MAQLVEDQILQKARELCHNDGMRGINETLRAAAR